AADPSVAARAENLGFPLCRRPALTSLLETAGFAQIETGAIEIPTDFANFDDYWQPFLGGAGTGPSFVTTLDPPSREVLRARLERRLELGADGRIRLKARAWAVRGLA
ncbi:MAG TPA: SAM-dependent methyltransferase, partial [Thermoanaerobaculia bacterium]|nr:SAM-dependent methyltransferase [Thermoanaerobaculia bacterium]